MKWKERENGYVRKAFALTEILLMSVPAYLSFVSNSFYFILQRLLEDELIIQVPLLSLAHRVVLLRVQSGHYRVSIDNRD